MKSTQEIQDEDNSRKLERRQRERMDKFASGVKSLGSIDYVEIKDGNHKSDFREECENELGEILADAERKLRRQKKAE